MSEKRSFLVFKLLKYNGLPNSKIFKPFSHGEGGGAVFPPSPSGNAYRARFGRSDCLDSFLTFKICQFFNFW